MNENTEMEIDLREIFQMLLKRWWLITIFVIMCMVGCGVYTVLSYVPMYSTYTTILVNRQDVNMGISSSTDYYMREDLLLTFQGIINSSNLQSQVAERVGSPMLGAVSVTSDESSIIKIRVTHIDPEMAAMVANETAIVFQEMIKNMMYDMDSSILDAAKVNEIPQGMSLKRNVAIGAVLGGMVSVGLIFLLEFLDQTIKTPQQTKSALDLPLMGVIPDIYAK